MRKILISLLLASAAASPAIAGPRDWSDRQEAHQDRVQVRDEARSDRSAERPSFAPRVQQVDRQAYAGPQVSREQYAPQMSREQYAPQFNRQQYVQQMSREEYASQFAQARDAYAAQRGERMQQMQQRFDGRRGDMRVAPDFRQSARPVPNVMRSRGPLVVSDTPRPGTQPPMRYEGRPNGETHWNTGWRHDPRYDWGDYRRHHRSLFHLGFYYDPYGWGYQPFSIGWRLWPAYYGNQFWIEDPWMYRLPYAPPGYVWVRYFNDALLVDTWSGTVVDMIPGFFW
jgi:Ni/Co efflux regulator RcnB